MEHGEGFGFSMIHNQEELHEYLDRLEKKYGPVELRYIAYTAMNGEKSFIADVVHKTMPYGLLVPHFWEMTKLPKRLTLRRQKLINLIRKGLQEKANLLLGSFRLISAFEVDNNNPLVAKKKHTKFLVKIINYQKYRGKHREPAPYKNEKPVWVRRNLFPGIFEKLTLVRNEMKKHGQHESYVNFSNAEISANAPQET